METALGATATAAGDPGVWLPESSASSWMRTTFPKNQNSSQIILQGGESAYGVIHLWS